MSDIFTVAAYLVHPYMDMPKNMIEQIDDPNLDSNALHSILRSNNVILRTLSQASNPSFPLAKRRVLQHLIARYPSFRKSYERSCSLTEELLKMAQTLNNKGVSFVFLKSINLLPLDSDNFDVLVRDEDLGSACSALESLGYAENTWVKEPYKRLFENLREPYLVLKVHLHTRIAWDGIEFLNCSDLWQMRNETKICGVTVGFPSTEHHMLITAAHAFFENHSLKLCDFVNMIQDIQSEQKANWNYLERWIEIDSWAKPFCALLEFEDYLHESLFMQKMLKERNLSSVQKKRNTTQDIVYHLVSSFEKRRALPIQIPILSVSWLYIKKIMKSRNLPMVNKMRTIALLFQQYAGRRLIGDYQPAFVISFCGKDGTGKTTHALQLWTELRRRSIRADYVWSRGIGLSFEPLLRPVRKLRLDRFQAGTEDYYQRNREKLINVKPIRILWKYMIIADHLIQIMTRVRTSLLRQNVVICDRYICDTVVDARNELDQNVSLTSQKILRNIVPQTAITFLMENEPSGSFTNESLIKDEVIRRENNAYRDCLSKENVILIDTTRPINENRTKILSAVLETFIAGKFQRTKQ